MDIVFFPANAFIWSQGFLHRYQPVTSRIVPCFYWKTQHLIFTHSRTFAFRGLPLKARHIWWRGLIDLCSRDTLQTFRTSLLSAAYGIMYSVNKNCRRNSVCAFGGWGGGCGIWKEVLSWHLPGRNDELTGNLSQDRRYGGMNSSLRAAGCEALTCSHNVRYPE